MQRSQIFGISRASRFFVAILLIGCSGLSTPVQTATPVAGPAIVFMTDFGTANDAVAIGNR